MSHRVYYYRYMHILSCAIQLFLIGCIVYNVYSVSLKPTRPLCRITGKGEDR